MPAAIKKGAVTEKTAPLAKQVEDCRVYRTSNLLLTGLLPPVTLMI